MIRLINCAARHRAVCWAALAILVFATAGCGDPSAGFDPTVAPSKTAGPSAEPAIETEQAARQPGMTAPAQDDQPEAPASFGYTYHRPDGNRLVAGSGSLPNQPPLDIPLGGRPVWLVAAPAQAGSIWGAVLEDGRVEMYRVAGGQAIRLPAAPDRLPAGMPPLLMVERDQPRLVAGPSPDSSPTSHPVVLGAQPLTIAYIAENGDLVVRAEEEIARLSVSALPDARILVDAQNRLLLLTDPTPRYDHGVLGDAIEAGSITLVETYPEIKVVQKIVIDPPAVIEGIAPIWTDYAGDSQREVIVTLSDASQGARVVVFEEDGTEVAASTAIGSGYRWRNQLAAAPTAPGGGLELVDVLTPHIGGVVEFFEMVEGRLEITAQIRGITSHVIGTRNLDMGLAGDFDGDRLVEVLLPTQELTHLAAIQHTPDGARLVWTLAAQGLISTNLAAVSHPDGAISLGVGTEDARLRIWGP